MSDRWMIRGVQFTNCNCASGCPCQFGSPTTYGFCEAFAAGRIDEGYFNQTRLDGLHFAQLIQWPGEIAEGNGRAQMIIDERGDAAQREALRKIMCGESTRPGATHFYVFYSTLSEVLDPLYTSIDFEVDLDARRARVRVPGLVESQGSPIVDANSGQAMRAGISLPDGFEFTHAEVGRGRTRSTARIELELDGTHAHWNVLHMNQDGVIR